MPIGRIGPDFIVDTTASGSQSSPSIAELADGRFVVAWTSADAGDGSGFCVRARLYGPDGTAQGNDFILDTTHTGDQDSASVTGLADGGFVVAWRSTDSGDGSGTCIRAVLCDADGTVVGNDFIVESTATGDQVLPAVAPLPDGGFVAAWQSNGGSPSSIRAGVFDADGRLLGTDFVVATTGLKALPAVATLAGGGFAVAWTTDQGGSADPDSAIATRLFDGAVVPQGPEFVVDSTATGIQTASSLAVLTDGRFVVAWQSGDAGDGDAPCIRARILDSNGVAVENDFLVNSTGASDQTAPSVTALADGRFVVVWQSSETGDGSGGCIRARVFNPDGTGDAGDFIVDTTVTGDQIDPSVTAFADGRFAVAWTSTDTGDGSGNCIRAAIFDPTTFVGTSAADTWQGGALVDHVNGGSNNDHLDGLAGDDIISGDSGLDVVTGGDGNDRLFGGTGLDTISGNDGNDFLSGDEGDDSLFGDAGDDIIRGGDDDDKLNGGAGHDIMAGGRGNDEYFVDSAGDIVVEASGGGADTVDAETSYALTAGSVVEFLRANLDTGTAPINLTGNEFRNFLDGNDGKNILDGGGGDDEMRGHGGNDTYIVDDIDDVVVEAADAGVDTVLSSVGFSLADAAHADGDLENLTLTGSADIDGGGNGLANRLTGNAGRNTLVGAGNNDTLNGRAGNDTLAGGGGHDAFVFNTALSAATNLDHITDFSVPADTIRLENAIFHGLPHPGVLVAAAFFKGTAAHDGNDRIIYNPANGFVIYDANGSAVGGAVHFASLPAHLAVTAADFFVF